MGDGEADELGRFRRNLEAASDEDLLRVATCTLDELIDLLRGAIGPHAGIESAAAVAAELHKRRQSPPAPTVRARTVGTA